MSSRIKRVTPVQRIIIDETVKQVKETGRTNMTQVGLKAFKTTNPRSARVMASKALQSTTVQNELEKALHLNGISLSSTLKEIDTIAKTEARYITGDVKLRALVELLKLQNAYPGKSKVTESFKYEERIKSLDHKAIETELTTHKTRLKEITTEDQA